MKRFSVSPLFLAAAVVFAPVAANAQTTAEYRCEVLPEQVRSAIAGAQDSGNVTRANRYYSTGVALCRENAGGAAARQFRAALRILGVEEARAGTTPAPQAVSAAN